ncbi:MAG: hypothetical protein ACM37U_15030 [Gemmatimonas sp.]
MSGNIEALFNRVKDLAYAARSVAYKALDGVQTALQFSNIKVLAPQALGGGTGTATYVDASITANSICVPILEICVIATAGTITVTPGAGSVVLQSSNAGDVSTYAVLVLNKPAGTL